MKKIKPVKLLILEDDEYECNRFKKEGKLRTDIELVAATNSCFGAIDYIKNNGIDGVILDIELQNGEGGDGIKFLKDLINLNLDIKPIIIVTTNIISKRVYHITRQLGADMVYSKFQAGYSPELIFDTFTTLYSSIKQIPLKSEVDSVKVELINDHKNWVCNIINKELEKIGLANHLKGSKYIFEAIEFVLHNNNDNLSYLPFLMDKHKTGHTNISNAMQTAINHIWKNTPPDELEKNYTAKVSHKKGVPTPVEFIYYYINKIKQLIS